jgi:type II secretory pathway component PulJ
MKAAKLDGMRPGRRRSLAGVTLAEAMVSLTLLALGYAGISMTNTACLHVVRRQRETVAAGQLLQERMEQMEAAGFSNITDATQIAGRVLSVVSAHSKFLGTAHELIRVSTYPAVVPAAAPIVVERWSNGTLTVTSTPPPGISLRNFLAVRVDVHVDWMAGDNARPRSREMSTIIAVGGLLQ